MQKRLRTEPLLKWNVGDGSLERGGRFSTFHFWGKRNVRNRPLRSMRNRPLRSIYSRSPFVRTVSAYQARLSLGIRSPVA